MSRRNQRSSTMHERLHVTKVGDHSMPAPTTDSFMYQTMHRQPEDLRRLLSDGWNQAADAADLVKGAGRVFVTGIGTSYHASLVGAWLLREAGLDARAVL